MLNRMFKPTAFTKIKKALIKLKINASNVLLFQRPKFASTDGK